MNTDTPPARTQAEELLKAGAVLPPDAEGAGERAVPLTTRAYRHPGLDDRVVVRLVAAELGTAEDLLVGFLGLEPDGEPAVVGLGLRRSLGFPEWVLVHRPEDGHHALAVVPELERTARQAKSKPKAALDAYQVLAGRLAAAVPHFLPTFYEQAGRVFLGVENVTYAAQMFSQARKAEAEHGLAVDEERLDEVFLEFALAGALPVKVLSGYARELTVRVPAEEALRRFTRLCVRRTAGGLPPSAQMATDLRRLAKAAGTDADAAEQAYLTELLTPPVTLGVATGWWKAHRTAIAALGRRDPEARVMLLNIMPETREPELAALWLEILIESGATAGLADGAPEEERPNDGTLGWLERHLKARDHVWGVPPRLPALYSLVERVADRLRAELAEAGRGLAVDYDLDLLDLLLALGIPVADPHPRRALPLEAWAQGEGQRDLLALAADVRFRSGFQYGADGFSNDKRGRRAIQLLTESPGGRPMLAEWMRTVARRSSAAGLSELPDATRRLAWLPGEALVLAGDEVREAAAADIAEVLARTLRTGLLDELSWPVWEEAAATLVPRKDVDELVVADAWPHLIVAGFSQVRVLGAEGVVLTHDLRVPRGDFYGDPGVHYVDGELLVYWQSYSLDSRLRGYWHNSAARLLPLEGDARIRGTRMDYYRSGDPVTLPLPGGGRATGLGMLHRGDTAVPAERTMIGDGTSFWVWTWEDGNSESAGWHEYDPASGRLGRRSLPGFLADALGTAPVGSELEWGWVLPAPDGGRLGWRVVSLPDGSLRGEDHSGRTVTLPPGAGKPAHALTFPGNDRPCAVVQRSYQISLVDADGIVMAEARTDGAPGAFAAGTVILPPLRFWHLLQPRDPEGSAALRRIDRDTAAALLEAGGGDEEDLRARIREVLPQVIHDGLVAGIAGVTAFAAAQRGELDQVTARLAEALDGGHRDEALDGGHRDEALAGPTDRVLHAALSGLGIDPRTWYGGEDDGAFRQLRAIARRAGDQPVEGRIHLDLPEFPFAGLRWDSLLEDLPALALRAASAAVEPDHRAALLGLLRELTELGLPTSADPSRWRRLSVYLGPGHLTKADGTRRKGSWLGVLPLDGGAFLAFVHRLTLDRSGCLWTALFHDPAGRFDVPAPYTVVDSDPVGCARQAGWLEAYLTEQAERGPAPWLPAAAEEFARLTGVSRTVARLVVAGMPYVDSYERSFLPEQARTALGVKVSDAAIAKEELRKLDIKARRVIVSALLPADPARLWTDGPDVTTAAEAWNAKVGQREAVPEWLLGEAARALRTGHDPSRALRAVIAPATTPELSRDLAWKVVGDRVRPADDKAEGFTGNTLVMAVATIRWLAHRLPAGDPIRAALPGALTALRERLAAPGLMLDLGQYVDLPAFRKVAGAPTEVGDGYERYGALIMSTSDDRPAPGIRTALLDPAGHDPYLRALLGSEGPFPAEVALRDARDPRLESLLADPGDPRQGERDADGTWWPQDPTRSVPDLVVEVAKEHGLSEDAAAVYLTLLAMPDPTDRHVARWTGWKPARFKEARAELAGTGLVVEASRNRAGRSLFLLGGWMEQRAPRLPLEQWKDALFDLSPGAGDSPILPLEPAADLYRRAWRRVRDGDVPRFEELKVRRAKRR